MADRCRSGFFDEAGLAVAQAVAGAPWTVVLVSLGMAILLPGADGFAIWGALAGALLDRRAPRGALIGLAVVAGVLSYVAWSLKWREQIDLDPLRIALVAGQSMVAALAGVAVGTRRWPLALFAAAIVGLWPEFSTGAVFPALARVEWFVVLASPILALAASALGRSRLALAIVVLGEVLVLFGMHWSASTAAEAAELVTRTLARLMLALTCVPVGLACAALQAGVEPDGGTRLGVLAIRRPWLAGLAVWLVPELYVRIEHRVVQAALGDWALAAVSVLFLMHFVRRTSSVFDRLVPVVVTVVIGAKIQLDLAASPLYFDEIMDEPTLVLLAVVCAWPLLLGALQLAPEPGPRTRPFRAVLAAYLVAMSALDYVDQGGVQVVRNPWMLVAWIVAATTLWQLALGSGVRTPALVALAAVGGAVCLLARNATSATNLNVRALVLPFAVKWTIAALLLCAMRRLRTFCAVPLDHPIVRDFGGA